MSEGRHSINEVAQWVQDQSKPGFRRLSLRLEKLGGWEAHLLEYRPLNATWRTVSVGFGSSPRRAILDATRTMSLL